MKNPPDKIYLQWHGDGEPDDVGEVSEVDVTWCKDRIYSQDIEYVQADRIAELAACEERAERAELFARHDHLSVVPIGDRESGFTEFRVLKVQLNDLGQRVDVFDDYFEFTTIVAGCDTTEQAIEEALAAMKEKK